MMFYEDWLPLLVMLLPALAAWIHYGLEIALFRIRYEQHRRA
jgi:hypothetical protein